MECGNETCRSYNDKASKSIEVTLVLYFFRMLYIGWARKRRQAAEDKGAASNERISEARTVKKLE